MSLEQTIQLCILVPFVGIKAIDLAVSALHLV